MAIYRAARIESCSLGACFLERFNFYDRYTVGGIKRMLTRKPFKFGEGEKALCGDCPKEGCDGKVTFVKVG